MYNVDFYFETEEQTPYSAQIKKLPIVRTLYPLFGKMWVVISVKRFDKPIPWPYTYIPDYEIILEPLKLTRNFEYQTYDISQSEISPNP